LTNLALRVATALVAVPLVVLLIHNGGPLLVVVLGLVFLVGQHEFYQIARRAGTDPMVWPGMAAGAFVLARHLWEPALMLGLVVPVLLLAALPLMHGVRRPVESYAVTLAGIIYPTLFISFIFDLRLDPGFHPVNAFWLTLGTFILVWVTDMAAYFTGKTIGRTPLAPTVSPKKTWEGAVGGLVGALAVAIVLKLTVLEALAWIDMLVVALLCGAVGQLGDLAQSKFKRAVDMKDSGALIPGHGGVLDRFDALILVAPLVYIYLRYLSWGAI
jgi:phosphatidate cytidylyltransferase